MGINAQGEKEAAAELAKAASISRQPGAMQLRYLHTLKNISVEKNSTIIFPLPMEIFNGFMQQHNTAQTIVDAITKSKSNEDNMVSPDHLKLLGQITNPSDM